ncbi:endospore germination permease [Paenibacillus sp. NEAU-GSW1]|uniref:GerAB/ArcD/ProY family transporter n=1 Tax=Paenibacillus sp. NEAU-GSW1 TaxID=2682486 RepID=UPI0012E2F569|nr:endospore germination permease [Paenibacillus sp. NEAU-GSW1]MUT65334.1 endospore germination permease [Paenibacillus sp. NEAU-GSW1]
MKDKMKISAMQLMLLVCSLLVASNMISLPMALTGIARQDAWIVFVTPIPYGIALAYIFWRLARKMPNKNIFEMAKLACGKWIGGALNAVLIAYLLLDLVGQIRVYSDFFSASILLRTPSEYVVLLTAILLMYIATGSTEHLARLNVVLIALFIIFYTLLPLLLLNEIDLQKLEPIMANGIAPPLKAGILAIGAYGDLIVMGAFLHHVRKPRDIYFSVKVGVIFSSFMLTIWLFCVVSVISPMLSSRLIYIGWIVVQQIHVTDFLDRIDLFLISLYVPILLIKFAILYTGVLTGLASYTKKKNYDFANVMTGLIVAMLTDIMFSNMDEVSMFNIYGIMPITIAVQVLFFGCLFIGFALKRSSLGGAIIADDRQNGSNGKLVWLSLFGCAAAIAFGAIYGHVSGMYGKISGILFICAFLLCVFFGINEYRQTTLKKA